MNLNCYSFYNDKFTAVRSIMIFTQICKTEQQVRFLSLCVRKTAFVSPKILGV